MHSNRSCAVHSTRLYYTSCDKRASGLWAILSIFEASEATLRRCEAQSYLKILSFCSRNAKISLFCLKKLNLWHFCRKCRTWGQTACCVSLYYTKAYYIAIIFAAKIPQNLQKLVTISKSNHSNLSSTNSEWRCTVSLASFLQPIHSTNFDFEWCQREYDDRQKTKCAKSKARLWTLQLHCWLVHARKNWSWHDVHMLSIYDHYILTTGQRHKNQKLSDSGFSHTIFFADGTYSDYKFTLVALLLISLFNIIWGRWYHPWRMESDNRSLIPQMSLQIWCVVGLVFATVLG